VESKQPRRVRFTAEAEAWLTGLPADRAKRVAAAMNRLEEGGPTQGRPLVDRLKGSRHHNMKELRVGTIRVLFVFERGRDPLMLVGGDKRATGNGWYKQAIRQADRLYDRYRRDDGREGPSHGPGAPSRGR
jgi:hypothetical protein